MASNFWERLLTSATLALLTLAGFAEPFGRFGYLQEGAVPGFQLDKSGFKVRSGDADTFWFSSSSRLWKPIATSDMTQVVALSGVAGSPDKLKTDLSSPGFALHFKHGFQFRVTSLKAPSLSWKDGSIEGDAGYPTPSVDWVLITFAAPQPPVLLGFPGAQSPVSCWGKTGDWRVGTKADWEGWVRVGAPFGVVSKPAATAAQLGELCRRAEETKAMFLKPPPVLQGLSVAEDEAGLTAQWTFDRPGSVVPYAASLAGMGGANISIMSPTKRLEAPTEEGPLVVCEGNELRVRFLCRRIPSGKAISGGPALPLADSVSAIDYASVAELALQTLLASTPPRAVPLGEDTFGRFVAETEYSQEPNTGQGLPYGEDGRGLDLVGVHSLLNQVLTAIRRPTSEANSLFTSLTWRRDWLSWSLRGSNRDSARRGAGMAAIAAALMPEPERRLDGAMLHAGLAAELGLEVWKRRNGLAYSPIPLLDSLYELQADIYDIPDYRRKPSLLPVLSSPLRAYGDVPAVTSKLEKGFRVEWPLAEDKAGTLTFSSAFPLVVSALKPETLTEDHAFGSTVFRWLAGKATSASADVAVPPWAPLVPDAPAKIEMTESRRAP